ncbi:MAG: Do family serine endopeptidase [Planctomycetota bacterium]
MRLMNNKALSGLLLASLAVAPVGIGLAVDSAISESTASASSLPLTEIARRLEPSVVSIQVVQKPRVQPMGEGGFPFFFGQPGPQRQVPQPPARGVGSGFIVDEDGYILTNSHVVKDAETVRVIFSDRRELDAKVIGVDPLSDVALIQVEADDLVPAQLGDSENIQVAETVLAFGSPFGLTQSVTSGIVSAKGRVGVGINDYEDFIQTDATINPGNSGGPLVNARGEVIGINSAILSRSGGSNGIGFAIPINMAKQVMNGLRENGSVSRGFLGVSIQDLTDDLAKSFELESTQGALVSDVVSSSPAEKAGLKVGDVIRRVDDREIYTAAELRQVIGSKSPKDSVEVALIRDGESETLSVTLGELDGTKVAATRALPEDLGLSIEDLSAEEAAAQGLSRAGARIREVAPLGPAARAGLRPGDLILAVGSETVHSAADVRGELAKSDLEDGVRLQIERQGTRHFVFLRRTS